MGSRNVEVVARVIGVKETDPLRICPVWVEIVQEQIEVRDLIAQAVEAQIHELLTRQKVDHQQAGHILDRYYPNPDSAPARKEAFSKRGKRLVGARGKRISVRTEIKRAFQAFESGAIAIFVDGQQMQDLDQQVTITSETKIKFVRLIPLTGG